MKQPIFSNRTYMELLKLTQELYAETKNPELIEVIEHYQRMLSTSLCDARELAKEYLEKNKSPS